MLLSVFYGLRSTFYVWQAPQFVDTIEPGDPLPDLEYHAFPQDEMRREVVQLRAVLAQLP